MAWTPTLNAVDTAQIEKNIFAYIADNQVDALEWANNGDSLKNFVFLEEAIADPDTVKFPSLAVVDSSETISFDEEVNEVIFEIGFESIIYHADASRVPLLMRKYGTALKSMLANIPAATLTANSSDTKIGLNASGVKVKYDATETNDQETAFFRKFTATATYRFWASIYS